MLDEIKKEEIPVEKVAWWIDINEKQCTKGYEFKDTPELVEKNIEFSGNSKPRRQDE